MKIGVIGGGAWGTALAQVASAAGKRVSLWALEPEVVRAINDLHENPLYLPGIRLRDEVSATMDLAELGSSDVMLVVTPAQHTGAVLERMADWDRPLVLCSKGIDEKSGELLHTVAQMACPAAQVAVLSGPTFAHEVAMSLPAAVTVAAQNGTVAQQIRDCLAQPTFRIYVSDDVVGAEVGGAVKNVLAIACGVVEGRCLGENARAAIIARGFAEMTRLGLALGARRETLAGLSGLGDLVLTCSSTRSRNFSLGKGIGEGRTAAELLSGRHTVAEGAFTAPVLARLARTKGVDMPIVDAVDALVAGRAELDQMLESLLTRPPKPEGT